MASIADSPQPRGNGLLLIDCSTPEQDKAVKAASGSFCCMTQGARQAQDTIQGLGLYHRTSPLTLAGPSLPYLSQPLDHALSASTTTSPIVGNPSATIRCLGNVYAENLQTCTGVQEACSPLCTTSFPHVKSNPNGIHFVHEQLQQRCAAAQNPGQHCPKLSLKSCRAACSYSRGVALSLPREC